jgi:hypothetical protein
MNGINKVVYGMPPTSPAVEASNTMEVETPSLQQTGASAARGTDANVAPTCNVARPPLYGGSLRIMPEPSPQMGTTARGRHYPQAIPHRDELAPIKDALLDRAAQFLAKGIEREAALHEKIDSLQRAATMLAGGMEPIWENLPQTVLQSTAILPAFFTHLDSDRRGRILRDLNSVLITEAKSVLNERLTTLKNKYGSGGVSQKIKEIAAVDPNLRLLTEAGKRDIESYISGSDFSTTAHTRAVAMRFASANLSARNAGHTPAPLTNNIPSKANRSVVQTTSPAPPKAHQPKVNKIGQVFIPPEIERILQLTGNFIGREAQATQSSCPSRQENRSWKEAEIIIPRGNNDMWYHPTTKHVINDLLHQISSSHKVDYEIVLAQAQNCLQVYPMNRQLPVIKDNAPWQTLLRFLLANKLIVKDADKGAGLTVIPLHWYTEQLLKAVKDATIYELKPNAPNPRALRNHLEAICRKHKIDNRWQMEDSDVSNPIMYLMPKLHKTPIGVRTIIPSYAWYTTRAAKWLHVQLFPMLKRYPWIITDRLQFIKGIEEIRVPMDGNTMLITMDVTAMYTNIELIKGLQIITEPVMTRFPKQGRFMLDLLHWVLGNNYFLVGNQWYRQTKGAAIGGNVSGTFADLVVGVVEERIWREQPAIKPQIYARFRDDTIAITNHAMRKTRKFAQTLSAETGLRFNIEQAGKQVHFLDLTIYQGERFARNRQLDFKPYVKPTNVQAFTHYTTYKPETTKTSWITGENIRILRGSGNREVFDAEINRFTLKLINAGYPMSVIAKRLKHSYDMRNQLMETTSKSHTKWFGIPPTVNAHQQWNVLQNNLETLLTDYNVSLTASRGRSLQDFMNGSNKILLSPTRKGDNP